MTEGRAYREYQKAEHTREYHKAEHTREYQKAEHTGNTRRQSIQGSPEGRVYREYQKTEYTGRRKGIWFSNRPGYYLIKTGA